MWIQALREPQPGEWVLKPSHYHPDHQQSSSLLKFIGLYQQQHGGHGTSSCSLPLGWPRLFYKGAGNWDRVLFCSPSCCWTPSNPPTSASRRLEFTGIYHHTWVVGLLLLTWSFFYQIGDIIVEWSVILRNIFLSCQWGSKFVENSKSNNSLRSCEGVQG